MSKTDKLKERVCICDLKFCRLKAERNKEVGNLAQASRQNKVYTGVVWFCLSSLILAVFNSLNKTNINTNVFLNRFSFESATNYKYLFS